MLPNKNLLLDGHQAVREVFGYSAVYLRDDLTEEEMVGVIEACGFSLILQDGTFQIEDTAPALGRPPIPEVESIREAFISVAPFAEAWGIYLLDCDIEDYQSWCNHILDTACGMWCNLLLDFPDFEAGEGFSKMFWEVWENELFHRIM